MGISRCPTMSLRRAWSITWSVTPVTAPFHSTQLTGAPRHFGRSDL
jgi:hypothetical protein